jgi:NADPH2:quinone reductase
MGNVPVLSLAGLKTVSAFSLLAWRAIDPERHRGADRAVRGGKLRARAEITLPLAEAVRAHRLLEERAVLGRVLLVP